MLAPVPGAGIQGSEAAPEGALRDAPYDRAGAGAQGTGRGSQPRLLEGVRGLVGGDEGECCGRSDV